MKRSSFDTAINYITNNYVINCLLFTDCLVYLVS